MIQKLFLLSILSLTISFGCGGDYDETIHSQSNALLQGNWINGDSSTEGLFAGSGGAKGPLAVCRARRDSGWHPGKVWLNQCHYGWGGKEYRTYSYQVLKNQGYQWVTSGRWVNNGFYSKIWEIVIPSKAIDGGPATPDGEHTVVCEAYFSGTWHPGKLWKGECAIGFDGQEERIFPKPENTRIAVMP